MCPDFKPCSMQTAQIFSGQRLLSLLSFLRTVKCCFHVVLLEQLCQPEIFGKSIIPACGYNGHALRCTRNLPRTSRYQDGSWLVRSLETGNHLPVKFLEAMSMVQCATGPTSPVGDVLSRPIRDGNNILMFNRRQTSWLRNVFATLVIQR